MSIDDPKKNADICNIHELSSIQDIANISENYEEDLEMLMQEANHILDNSSLIQEGKASAKATMVNAVELTTVANISAENGKPQISFEQSATMDRLRLIIEMDLK